MSGQSGQIFFFGLGLLSWHPPTIVLLYPSITCTGLNCIYIIHNYSIPYTPKSGHKERHCNLHPCTKNHFLYQIGAFPLLKIRVLISSVQSQHFQVKPEKTFQLRSNRVPAHVLSTNINRKKLATKSFIRKHLQKCARGYRDQFE